MTNQLKYEIVTKEGGEQFILLYELGKEQTPLALISAKEVNQWAYELQQELKSDPFTFSGVSVRIVTPDKCPKHVWSPVHTYREGLLVATHTCGICGQLGYKELLKNKVYAVDFTCEGCQTAFASELWKMKCPRCGYDNLPF